MFKRIKKFILRIAGKKKSTTNKFSQAEIDAFDNLVKAFDKEEKTAIWCPKSYISDKD